MPGEQPLNRSKPKTPPYRPKASKTNVKPNPKTLFQVLLVWLLPSLLGKKKRPTDHWTKNPHPDDLRLHIEDPHEARLQAHGQQVQLRVKGQGLQVWDGCGGEGLQKNERKAQQKNKGTELREKEVTTIENQQKVEVLRKAHEQPQWRPGSQLNQGWLNVFNHLAQGREGSFLDRSPSKNTNQNPQTQLHLHHYLPTYSAP